MSIVNTAVTAVMGLLTQAPAVCPVVERVRLRALPAGVFTALVVRPLQSEVLEGELPTGYPISWNTAIAVECYARASAGVSPDVAVDALVAAAYARLMADPTLGGAVVVLQPLAASYDFDVDGQQVACVTLTFQARQRTAGAIF